MTSICQGPGGIMEADYRQVTTVFTVQPSFHHRHSTNLISWSVTIVGERRSEVLGVTTPSPTMVTLHDTRFVQCRWWNDGWTVNCRHFDDRRPLWYWPLDVSQLRKWKLSFDICVPNEATSLQSIYTHWYSHNFLKLFVCLFCFGMGFFRSFLLSYLASTVVACGAPWLLSRWNSSSQHHRPNQSSRLTCLCTPLTCGRTQSCLADSLSVNLQIPLC